MKRIVILTVLFAGWALAQPGLPGREGGYTDLQAYLGLTGDQLNSFRGIQEEQDRALRPIHDQINQKTVMLYQLLNQGGDSTAIGQVQTDIFNLYKELSSSAITYEQQIFSILTPSQKSLLPGLANARMLSQIATEAIQLHFFDDPTLPRVTAPDALLKSESRLRK